MAYAPQTPLMTSPLLPDVYQAAIAAQLGDQPRTEYRVTLTRKGLLTGIAYLIVGIVLIIAGIAVAASSTSDDSSGAGTLLVLAILGLISLGAGLYSLLYGVFYQGWHVYVYERGFIYKKGSAAAQPFRWDQVEAAWYSVTRRYYNGIYMGTTHNYRVRRQDGYTIVLNNRFTNVGALGETINNEVTRAKLPQVIAAYDAGQTITFGPLSLNKQGIQNIKGVLLPWSEIKDVSLQSGYVAVSKAGKWLRWSSQPVRDIPNVFLFIAMTRFILKK